LRATPKSPSCGALARLFKHNIGAIKINTGSKLKLTSLGAFEV
jgi:hypothetical protein